MKNISFILIFITTLPAFADEVRIQVIPFNFRYERFIAFDDKDIASFGNLMRDTLIVDSSDVKRIVSYIRSSDNPLSGYPYDDYRAKISYISCKDTSIYYIGLRSMNVNGYYKIPPLKLLQYLDRIIVHDIYHEEIYKESFPLEEMYRKRSQIFHKKK